MLFRSNRKDFGYGDLRDLLAGVDVVTKKLPIDPDRIGLTGWSYGGFMTMFAVTQTHRFRAAVAGAGISNWESYYGENSIDQWMIPFFGASVYDDPAVYAKSSAIGFIKNAKTPMLIFWGLRDFVFDRHFLRLWEERFPRAETHRFEDCGHYILEDAREEILPSVRNFLERT